MAKEEKEVRKRNPEAAGIAGFTLGIISLVMLIFSPIIGVLLSIVGIFLCLKQQRKEKTRTARVGLILNIIGLVANVAWWIVSVEFIYPYLNSVYQQQLSNSSLYP